jgi:hypothetical protein
MLRTQTLTISDIEMETELGLKADYDHREVTRGSYGSPTVLAASVRYYRDKEYNIISTREAAGRLVTFLEDKGYIPNGKVMYSNIRFNASHSWSAYNDEGYAHSIYTHKVEVTVTTERIGL